MENIDVTSFRVLDIKIEDGFEYGDWRDQWMSDKLYEQVFNPEISLYDDQTNTSKWLLVFIQIFGNLSIPNFSTGRPKLK